MNNFLKLTFILLITGLSLLPAFAQQSKLDTGLVHVKTISGTIRPKSIVHNDRGLFFAQNMMYRHSITIYDRAFQLKKTISDEVTLSKYGVKGYKGKHQGAPVEATFSPDGKYAWISNYQMYGKGFDNPGSDNCKKSSTYDKSFLYKIDTDQQRIVGVLEAGCVPKHLACSPDGKLLLVSNWCSGDLNIFDAQHDSLITSLDMGKFPRGVAIDRRSRFAYVAVMGSSRIARVDLHHFTVKFIEKVGRTPRHICISPDDKFLYVSLNAPGKVLKYDLKTLKLVKAKDVGTTPRSMVLSPEGAFLYVVNYKDNRMTKIKTADMAIVQRVVTQSKPIGITLDAEENNLWVACYTGSIMVFKDHNMVPPQPVASSAVQLHRAYFPFFSLSEIPVFEKEKLSANKIARPLLAEKKAENELKKESLKPGFYIILGSFQVQENAENASKAFLEKGIETNILEHSRGKRLAYGSFPNKELAQAEMATLKLKGWILKLEE